MGSGNLRPGLRRRSALPVAGSFAGHQRTLAEGQARTCFVDGFPICPKPFADFEQHLLLLFRNGAIAARREQIATWGAEIRTARPKRCLSAGASLRGGRALSRLRCACSRIAIRGQKPCICSLRWARADRKQDQGKRGRDLA